MSTSDVFLEARDNFQSGELVEAEAGLRKVLSRNAVHVDSLLLLGEIMLGAGDAFSAEEYFSEALMQGADSPQAMVLLAEAYLKQGKMHSILANLPMTGRHSAQAAEVLGYQAIAYFEQGAAGQANALIRQALNLHPQALMPRVARSRVLLATDLPDSALALAIALSREFPESARAWSNLGQAAQVNGESDMAVSAYHRALELDAHLLHTRISRARLLVYLGRDEDSWEDLDFMEVYYPAEPRAAFLRALVYERAGATAVATIAFRECAHILRGLPEHWIAQSAQLTLEAAGAHIRLGEYSSARSYLESYRSFDQDNQAVNRRLASLLVHLREAEESGEPANPVL